MSYSMTNTLRILLLLAFLNACSRPDIQSPEQQQELQVPEESVFLVQLGNTSAAYDWHKRTYNWMTDHPQPSEFVKSGDPAKPSWYRISMVHRVTLESWADSSSLTTRASPEFITTFDPVTGRRLEGMPNKLTPDFYIKESLYDTLGGGADGRVSRATIIDEKVVVVRGDRRRSGPTAYTIQALDFKSGDILWTYYLADKDIVTTSFRGTRLYIGCPENSFAIDMATGKKIMDYPFGGIRVASDKYLFSWTYGKNLILADILTGQIKWTFGADANTDLVEEMLVADQTALFTVNGILHIVDANSGVAKWTFADLNSKSYFPRTRVLVDKQALYVIDRQLRVNAFDLADGTKKWQSVSFQVAGFDGSDMTILAGKNKLYVQQRRDQVITLDPNSGDHSSNQVFWAADLSPIRDFKILY